jgi:hypothetical protein
MDSPFMRRIAKRHAGHNGRVAEVKAADRLGGKLRLASGAVHGVKGDFITRQFLYENKATQTGTLSLKRDWCYKIYQEALEQDKIPALAFQFTNEEGASEKRERWVAVPEHLFKELTEKDE